VTRDDVLAEHKRRLHGIGTTLGKTQSVQLVARTALGAAVCLFVVLGIYAVKKQIPFAWPLLAGAGAVFAARVYAKSRRTGYRARRLKRFYTRAVARLEGDWPGSGDSGEEFNAPGHVYARDLNLFGEGSLFELLSISRTGVGRHGLARYLLEAAPVQEILARQQAVRELSDCAGLREEIALLGSSDVSESRRETFARWLGEPPAPFPAWFRFAILVTSAIAAGVIASGLFGLLPWAGTAKLLAPVAVAHAAAGLVVRRRVNRAIVSLRVLAGETGVIREGLELIERQRFSSTKLAKLAAQARGSADSMKRLEVLLRVLEERHKEWFYLPGLILMLGTQVCAAVEEWRIRHGAALSGWLDAWSELEALNSLASFCYENPDHVFPEIAEGPARVETRAIGHPLLPHASCVRNDVELNAASRFFVISGSNMSGKSTLLRAIGLNAVLALAGAPVRAEALRISPLAICASMALVDSLLNGKSKFLAEVDRLRAAIELTGQGRPVLFLIDEIFSGTNSRDRRAAAEAVIRTLISRGAIGALSTHDLALSEIADGLVGANVHMGSRNGTDPMDFDYRLKPGVTREANALAIARMVGVPL
jgi:DNA mismatch repair ATPase MutS